MILKKLMAWATDPTDTKIYWLSGMAGTGKTAIAYSFSEILESNCMLGATFFCSCAEQNTKNPHLIFPTIAYELALRFSSMRTALMDVLGRDADAGNRIMAQQFNNLIVRPLKAAGDELRTQSAVVIIIDALDECDNQNDISDMLSIILRYSPDLPVKFFITSRPEPEIRRGFNRREFQPHSRFLLHNVEKDIVSADIKIYARERLLDIADGRSDSNGLLDDWPPEDQLETLVRLAGCLFIYAAAACEYVAGGGNVRERLAVVTSISPRNWNGKTDALDALYDNILTAAYTYADEKEREEICQVLRAVIIACNPLSINGLSILLNISGPKVRGSLASLHSIIYIPPSGDPNIPVSTFHASFPEYVTDHKRSRDNFVDSSETHQWLALHCLNLMQKRLRTNICRLGGRPPNHDIPRSAITKFIPEALAYACTCWALHVANTCFNEARLVGMYEAVLLFFDNKVLQWVECLSLIGRLPVAITLLRRLESWAKVRRLYVIHDKLLSAMLGLPKPVERHHRCPSVHHRELRIVTIPLP
jgi:NACHT domain